MKKAINKKALILPLLILAMSLVVVSAPGLDPGGEMDIGGVDPGNAVSGYVLEPVKNFFNKYIIPNYSDLLGDDAPYNIWAIISVFGFLIFCSIIFEIVMTVSPLNWWINVSIGIFMVLIFTLFGWFRSWTGGLMAWITILTGAAGIFGMIMLGVIFLIGGIAMFTGWTWAHKWIAKIKYNKQLTKQGGKAMNKASDVNALTDFAGAVDAHKA